MLAVANLNQFYGGSHILRELSFDVPAGRVTALLGRNGVGKTTLLRTLMGLLPARTGRIRFGEADLTAAKPYERVRAGIGYVPQGREIFPRLTVEENLKMGLATRPRRRRSLWPGHGNVSKLRAGSSARRGRVASPIFRFSSTVSRGKISRPCGT